MDALTIVIVVAVLLAAAFATYRWSRSRPAAEGHWSAPAEPGARDSGAGTVVLDLDAADRQDEAVRRLAEAVGRDALHQAEASVGEIVVTDRAGQVLATVARPKPMPNIAVPEGAPELAPKPSREPRVVRSEPSHASVARSDDDVDTSVARDLASRFVLTPMIEARLTDRDDAPGLVRAILETAGHELSVVDGVIRTGDHAVIVLGDAHGHGVSHDDLSSAFLRFQRSGARRGTAIVLGYVSPREVSRRQALAPDLSYVGPETIQRMADAAALGVDPLRFATGGLA